MAREAIMSTHISLQKRINNYLNERRRLGFQLHSLDTLFADFARFVASRRHRGPLTIELMGDWARQAKGGNGTRETWFRRLRTLRPFICYLKRFEPDTEIPKESIFGPTPGRVAPHIYHQEEIIELLVAARRLGPRGSLRPETFETLFGLMASTGLRISEAIHLHDSDVDLNRGMLTIRQTKFAKSRQLPLHPSTVAALKRYRCKRAKESPIVNGS
jgi:integrase